MIRAVLDCNVVITAALSAGKCADILSRALLRDGFELVWSPPIVAECLRVIEYPKLAGRFRTDPRLLVERAMATAHMIATALLPAIDVVKDDPSDNVYLATALAGGARRVVTGNTRHLTPHDGYAGLRIVAPALFLAELDAVAGSSPVAPTVRRPRGSSREQAPRGLRSSRTRRLASPVHQLAPAPRR